MAAWETTHVFIEKAMVLHPDMAVREYLRLHSKINEFLKKM